MINAKPKRQKGGTVKGWTALISNDAALSIKRTGYRLFVILASDQRDRADANASAGSLYCGGGQFILQFVGEMPGRESFAKLVRYMERERVGIMPERLVGM